MNDGLASRSGLFKSEITSSSTKMLSRLGLEAAPMPAQNETVS
eukprot:COSAG06_NODE_1074_length_10817_cov_7.629315_8_plen_43_part_00